MNKLTREQGIPLFLTVLTFFSLVFLLFLFISGLNLLPTTSHKILLELKPQDVLVGLIIYLKTAIDFAIFIGNLMRTNPGWRKRIAIEIGTAIGNAFGTLLILVVWNFFREVPILMAIMIIIASLVLLRMAEESIEEFLEKRTSGRFHKHVSFIQTQLNLLNKIFKPFLKIFIPNLSIINPKTFSFWGLAFFSFTIPFILGLDDFAGYIPLFSIINVFGFAVGVFLGHMILNAGLFIMPRKTTELVENSFVLIAGGLAFVGIAGWGFYEAIKLLFSFLG